MPNCLSFLSCKEAGITVHTSWFAVRIKLANFCRLYNSAWHVEHILNILTHIILGAALKVQGTLEQHLSDLQGPLMHGFFSTQRQDENSICRLWNSICSVLPTAGLECVWIVVDSAPGTMARAHRGRLSLGASLFILNRLQRAKVFQWRHLPAGPVLLRFRVPVP